MTPYLTILAVLTFAALIAILDAARGNSEANRIRKLLRAIFPVSTLGTAETYVNALMEHQPGESDEMKKFIDKRTEIFADLEARVNAATDERIIEAFRETTVSRLKSEDERQASVMTRAQNLLSGIALFGVVLTFAGSLGTLTAKHQNEIWTVIAAILAGYVIVNIVLMTFNVLRSASGLDYTTAGNSDLAKWVSSSDVLVFYRAQTLMALDHLRHAKANNDWRFAHLHLAQAGLRNITYALSLLALTALTANVVPQ